MSQTKSIAAKAILNSIVTPPGSKSITNRALILASLARGKTTLTGTLSSEDTIVMANGLEQLNLEINWDKKLKTVEIKGLGGCLSQKHQPANRQADIYVGNSGTTARFLTAMLAFTEGNYRIHGKPRMHERPIKDLVDALHTLGGNVAYEGDAGFPPLRLGTKTQGRYTQSAADTAIPVSVAGNVSSQFLTALLLASPLAAKQSGITFNIVGELVSKPYIEMTIRMMKSFGIHVEIDSAFRTFHINQGASYLSPGEYAIEPDASAASYFLAAPAICGGSITIAGLSKNSLQGDVGFADCLEKMNCDVIWNDHSITVNRPADRLLRGIKADMNCISDTAQTLAVVALFAKGPTEIRNIEHVRHKETDRIADLATELRRFGAGVEEFQDGLRITPPDHLLPATVQTYDDHRMAMSFAVAGLRIPGVQICNPDCTHKTFPEFFDVLDSL